MRQRPNFAEVLDYVVNRQETVKCPDRTAGQLRNHPYLAQLDDVGMPLETEEQQEDAAKEQCKEQSIREIVQQTGMPAP